jgi:hypothetical protein
VRVSKAAPWVLVAVALAACHQQPPAAKLAKQAEPVGSWLATLQMTAERWSANSVPTHFARDTTAAAKKEIEAAAEAARTSDAPPGVREPLRRLLAESHIAARALGDALERGDRRAAPALAARFHTLADRFDAWKQSATGGES